MHTRWIGVLVVGIAAGCKPATPCNATAVVDADADGASVCSDGSGVVDVEDCDDGNAAMSPLLEELCTDGLDNDCNGAADAADTSNCGTDDTDVVEETDDTAACDTATDTDCGPVDPLLINTFAAVCEPDTSEGCGSDCGSKWHYEITVSGANSGGLVLVEQDTVDSWEESHDLTGASTTLSVDLVGAHVDDQMESESTLFQCSMDTNMAWRYEVYATDLSLADCVVATGSEVDPADFFGVDFGGCSNGNDW
jgi:hypothetical protein